MEASENILGIDIGSVSIHVVLISSQKRILQIDSITHKGEVKPALTKVLSRFLSDKESVFIATTDTTPNFIKTSQSFDDQLSLVKAGKHLHPSFDAILQVGGEKFSLSRFDRTQKYIGANHNTSCAAGTGAFLDQQARRLKLEGGSHELSRNAMINKKEIPQIATRCAVFAKTDLIHAQQEGYEIEQICDGLCFGLAKNLVNTLFKNKKIGDQIIFCGGVSQNASVVHHLEDLTGHQFMIDTFANHYGAIGAALCLHEQLGHARHFQPIFLSRPEDLFTQSKKQDNLLYPPLSLKLSTYPDFDTFLCFEKEGVETDIYINPEGITHLEGFLGIDVGSTSTKSILIDMHKRPVAGFYTRTASRPVQAVQKILKAYDQFFDHYNIDAKVKGCGTTGSGRRISAKIIGADIEPDEITAHAAAACQINPQVDTIIEIGGQDAKFTTLKNGVVTSSTMNTVCAAGTGSFIEEQALKLGCPLTEYSDQAENISAPMASDRCTVFMERDINHYFAQGSTKREVLASVLHSVRDNYLTKVATPAKIGDCILFQGATAKNKALISAFEQKLNKPIQVSKYCHLTGALGVALLAHKKMACDTIHQSNFKGFDLWEKQIPIRREICSLCQNHCKLTIASVDGVDQAYGFLCGRDYDTQKKVAVKTEYNLLDLRKKCIPKIKHSASHQALTIGIPQAVHLFDDHEFWNYFFNSLGFKTISGRSVIQPVKKGKTIATAEFCAPLTALHGHVLELSQKADYIFLPFYFEDKAHLKNTRRQYCYYSQFSPSVLSCLPQIDKSKLITPVVKYLYTSFHTKLELYRTLKKLPGSFSFFDISNAYDRAVSFKKKVRMNLKNAGLEKLKTASHLNVVFIGRPYTVLTKHMNNNIPYIFENLGVQTLFQDMLDLENHDFSKIEPLLKEIHWKYAATILKAAYVAAKTENLYPVFISSFRCAPDSFAIDYFKQILEQANKPYLVLELDEHDSSVGYETRVEAAVRAFENHQTAGSFVIDPKFEQLHPHYLKTIENKTVIFPNWDSYTGSLIVSIMKNEGYQAHLMVETKDTLKKSLLTNTGQCIPLNAVASGYIHTIESKNLDPAKCALWLNPSEIACNIKLYPYQIRKILNEYGHGFEKTHIYQGELSLFDISFKASKHTYFAYMFGGLLRSIGCRLRPYEVIQGSVDQALDGALEILCRAFEHGTSKEKALATAMKLFKQIETRDQSKPKVGIFGDLYVRDNDIMNQNLIRFIEEQGGEVITTPYYKYVKIIANSYFKKWFKEGKYFSLISNKTLFVAMQAMEKKYYKYFDPILSSSDFNVNGVKESVLKEYGLVEEHTGESMDNILKIHHLVDTYPDMALLVQTTPSFCCPGLITEAMAQKIEEKTGIPVISITYDVSGGNKNKVIIPFLHNRQQGQDHSHNLKASV